MKNVPGALLTFLGICLPRAKIANNTVPVGGLGAWGQNVRCLREMKITDHRETQPEARPGHSGVPVSGHQGPEARCHGRGNVQSSQVLFDLICNSSFLALSQAPGDTMTSSMTSSDSLSLIKTGPKIHYEYDFQYILYVK